MTTTIKYLEDGTILKTVQGVATTIPDNMGNSLRSEIAEWEAEGNTIAAYVAPAEPAATTKLINRVQFKSMLALMGKTIADVLTAIDAVITDPTQNIIAKIKVTDSTNYARNNALFTLLGPALSLTDAQIDAAWAQALEI